MCAQACQRFSALKVHPKMHAQSGGAAPEIEASKMKNGRCTGVAANQTEIVAMRASTPSTRGDQLTRDMALLKDPGCCGSFMVAPGAAEIGNG